MDCLSGAVASVQRSLGLVQDGLPGPATERALGGSWAVPEGRGCDAAGHGGARCGRPESAEWALASPSGGGVVVRCCPDHYPAPSRRRALERSRGWEVREPGGPPGSLAVLAEVMSS